MSLSFMMRSSSPSILTSVPDHLPNSTRSPGFTSRGWTFPFSSGAAGAYGDDFAPLRLLLGGIRNDNAALGPLVLLDPAYDDAVMQWTKLHLSPPAISDVDGCARLDAPVRLCMANLALSRREC